MISTLLKISLLCIVLLLAACSAMQFGPSLRVLRIEEMELVEPGQIFDKSLYDVRSRTLYCLDSRQQEVHFFRAGQRINRLGGLGSDRDRFLRLADVALDADGSLLCLDAMNKQISKFSPDGAWVGTIDLETATQPELLCVNSDRTMYVYDAAPQEIICFNSISFEESFRFGRFQLPLPTNLSCSNNQVLAYNHNTQQSILFSSLGEFIRTFQDLRVYDGLGNIFVWNGLMLQIWRESSAEPELELVPSMSLMVKGRTIQMNYSQGTLLLHNNNAALVYRVVYQNRYE